MPDFYQFFSVLSSNIQGSCPLGLVIMMLLLCNHAWSS